MKERKKNKNWRRNNEFYRHVKAKKKIINIKSALQGILKGHLEAEKKQLQLEIKKKEKISPVEANSKATGSAIYIPRNKGKSQK